MTKNRINDGGREVFDKGGETIGMKNREDAVWERI